MAEQKVTTGKVIRGIGRQLVRPWSHLWETGAHVVQRVSDAPSIVRTLWRERKARLDQKRATGQALEQGTLDGHARFAALYDTHEWTEEQLLARCQQYLKTKWLCFWLGCLCVFSAVACALVIPGWNGALYVLGLLFSAGWFFVQVFRFSLYVAQMLGAELFTARQFFSRPDFFREIFR